MAKFYLSPSDQKGNVYKGINTNEAVVCGNIAYYCEQALKRNGHEVAVGHYMTMANKCMTSDAFNADMYVPIHTNAFNGEIMGTRIFCYDLKGKGYQMAKKVFDVLAPFSPGTSENIKAAPELYEVRTPKAPTVYIEIEFHDTEKGASWLAANVEEIGEKIAEALCSAVGASYIAKNMECGDGVYNKGCDPCLSQSTTRCCCKSVLEALLELLRDTRKRLVFDTKE